MVNDADVKVLLERMNANLDWQKRMDGKMDTIVQLQLTLASQQEQIRSLEGGQRRLFEKSDEVDDAFQKLRSTDIQPLRDDMIGNKRAVRVIGAVGTIVIGLSGALYTQWKPWAADLTTVQNTFDEKIAHAKEARDAQLSKYQFDVGSELRRDDNRLTVLEFRVNNIDQKASK